MPQATFVATDLAGVPVADATVIVTRADGQEVQTTSDAMGQATVTVPATGIVDVRLEATATTRAVGGSREIDLGGTWTTNVAELAAGHVSPQARTARARQRALDLRAALDDILARPVADPTRVGDAVEIQAQMLVEILAAIA